MLCHISFCHTSLDGRMLTLMATVGSDAYPRQVMGMRNCGQLLGGQWALSCRRVKMHMLMRFLRARRCCLNPSEGYKATWKGQPHLNIGCRLQMIYFQLRQ